MATAAGASYVAPDSIGGGDGGSALAGVVSAPSFPADTTAQVCTNDQECSLCIRGKPFLSPPSTILSIPISSLSLRRSATTPVVGPTPHPAVSGMGPTPTEVRVPQCAEDQQPGGWEQLALREETVAVAMAVAVGVEEEAVGVEGEGGEIEGRWNSSLMSKPCWRLWPLAANFQLPNKF